MFLTILTFVDVVAIMVVICGHVLVARAVPDDEPDDTEEEAQAQEETQGGRQGQHSSRTTE